MDERTYANVAVLLPCYNEERTIEKVVRDFANALPGATIHVFDNNSVDRTAEFAKAAGAVVHPSPLQGKGNVVRHMFTVVDAARYIMADGDDTYPARFAPELLRQAELSGADMVIGTRLSKFSGESFRKFHQFGNRVISFLIAQLFKVPVSDVLSGYRVFSRNFAKSIPIVSAGFEIETELTLQAAAKRYSMKEFPIEYGSRPEGSISKLNTWSDGFLILRAILMIFKDFKPLIFYTTIAFFVALLSIWAGWAPMKDYVDTGIVIHLPRAVLAAGLAMISAIMFGIGLILDTSSRYHRENFDAWRRRAGG